MSVSWATLNRARGRGWSQSKLGWGARLGEGDGGQQGGREAGRALGSSEDAEPSHGLDKLGLRMSTMREAALEGGAWASKRQGASSPPGDEEMGGHGGEGQAQDGEGAEEGVCWLQEAPSG